LYYSSNLNLILLSTPKQTRIFIRGKDKSLKQNVSDNGLVVLHKNAELCKTLHMNGKQRALQISCLGENFTVRLKKKPSGM
jgi:hypothetical protein